MIARAIRGKRKILMNHSELEAAVLEFVNRPNYKPVKPRIIAKKLGLDEKAVENLKRAVKSLVKSGQLAYGQNHLLLPGAKPVDSKRGPVASVATDGKKSPSRDPGPLQGEEEGQRRQRARNSLAIV